MNEETSSSKRNSKIRMKLKQWIQIERTGGKIRGYHNLAKTNGFASKRKSQLGEVTNFFWNLYIMKRDEWVNSVEWKKMGGWKINFQILPRKYNDTWVHMSTAMSLPTNLGPRVKKTLWNVSMIRLAFNTTVPKSLSTQFLEILLV